MKEERQKLMKAEKYQTQTRGVITSAMQVDANQKLTRTVPGAGGREEVFEALLISLKKTP